MLNIYYCDDFSFLAINIRGVGGRSNLLLFWDIVKFSDGP